MAARTNLPALDLRALRASIARDDQAQFLTVVTGCDIDDALQQVGADRWLRFDSIGSLSGWQDMADFAERQREAGLRKRLERAIRGSGAFRRFRDVVHHEGLAEQWDVFCTDRQLGRAREFLADSGIRVG